MLYAVSDVFARAIASVTSGIECPCPRLVYCNPPRVQERQLAWRRYELVSGRHPGPEWRAGLSTKALLWRGRRHARHVDDTGLPGTVPKLQLVQRPCSDRISSWRESSQP
jgi:hypothetical protein